VIVRLAAALVLSVWLAGGLLLTLQPAHPAPSQIVEHNFIPLRTISIYLANLDSPFWLGQMVGNLLLLLPVGLLGPVVLPWMDRWLRVLVASLALSTDRARAAGDSRSLGRGRRRPAERGGSNPWLRSTAGASNRIAPPARGELIG